MKAIIVTGANGNLGAATVRKLLEEGYQVIAVDNHSNQLDFAMNHDYFEFHSINLKEEEETAAFVHSVISRHGRVDGGVMLVGGFTAGSIADTGDEAIDAMIALNFKTAFHLAKPLLSHMEGNQQGRLIFIGARPALKPSQGKDLMAYALSKSLLFNLADFINESVIGKNISASVIVPSTIDTVANRKAMPDANPENWVKPEQLADMIELVLSQKGSALRETVLKVYHNS